MLTSETVRTIARSRHFEGTLAPAHPVYATTTTAAPGIAARAARLGPVPSPEPAGHDAAGDWDSLLDAVKARLRLIAASHVSAADGLEANGPSGRIQGDVLDCADALAQLQFAMAHELGRRRQLERDLFDARAALTRARAELAGTQAGEQQARHRALHDDLTSLPNRRYFRERLDLAVARADAGLATAAVLFIDLDGFKAINDAHGHDVGDELLRIVGARLSHTVRAADMVSRIGGDEFACLPAEALEGPQLRDLAGKLFDAISAPLTLGGLRLRIFPSIGVASYPADGSTADALLRSADTAMYLTKRERSGYAFFRPFAAGASPAA